GHRRDCVFPALPREPPTLELERERGQGDERSSSRHERAERLWIPRYVEAAAVTHERDQERESEGRLFHVQSFRHMRKRDPDDQEEREVPGTTAAACERARQPDEAEPERKREDTGGSGHSRWKDAPDEVGAVRVLGRQRCRHANHTDDCGGRAEPKL